MATSTPWGAAQQSVSLCRGIVQYSTAGHGGVHLSPTRNMVVPEYMRNADGWYEEDCEWAIPATIFPEVWVKHYPNSPDILKTIKDTLRNWYPDMYEQFYESKIKNGTSMVRDDERFDEEHKTDWIVYTATGHGNMVECNAALGGWNNRHNSEQKTFWVSSEEYATRSHRGFVIDLNRHVEKGNEPTWKNTLYDHLQVGGGYNEMSDMIDEAYKLGYPYMCWNGRIYSIHKSDCNPYEVDTSFTMEHVK